MASTSITQTTTPPKYYDFYDEAIIYVRAGSGGQGATTFQAKGGKPNGGHGGKGGDILLQLDSSINTLSHLNNPTNSWIRSFRAPNGADGKVAFKNGKWADNVIIPVPSGTIVQELPLEEKTDDEEEDETTTTYIKKRQQLQSKKHTIELSYATNVTTIRLAKGGEGGDGNAGSATHPGSSTTRRVSPQGGERKRIQLILKIVGDVAIVGLPNAGKSTFLASVTAAKPKIANYPFTTIIPNLGVWNNTLVLCDVPGLISGAANGIGLGHAFLRHVERSHVVLHIIDATSDDPLRDFDIINHELTRYDNGCLVNKPQVVVVNKMDAYNTHPYSDKERNAIPTTPKLSKDELQEKLLQKMSHTRLMFMSASEKDGVDDLMHRLYLFTEKVKAAT
eukprot:CAMPEP_0172416432 /NCGR_PEP_ID=MMETSP1064-20121228/2917_1 /TAXON_ID=202472 /ORGANISM="Aulacoseira subarctica , Strain CCAP 1002/5" /LENGTH=391 /DNA_ID=CAMNT_0013154079 /DNA_START=251 /DNA_END=1423 /DNA_ORIENTATION=+